MAHKPIRGPTRGPQGPNHRYPAPQPVTSIAESAAASTAWGCAGGCPSPPRVPSVPSPAAPPGSRRPTRNAPAQCGLRGQRLRPPPCAAAAQANRVPSSGGTLRRRSSPPTGQRPLHQARGKLQPAAGQGQRAPTPQPTARLAESPTRRPPIAAGARQEAGAPRSRSPHPQLGKCCSLVCTAPFLISLLNSYTVINLTIGHFYDHEEA